MDVCVLARKGARWVSRVALRDRLCTCPGERAMSKGLDSRREAKEKLRKSLQEKRAAKRENRAEGFRASEDTGSDSRRQWHIRERTLTAI